MSNHPTLSLIVDVKLSASRTAKIQIWRGDDPRELATTFARVYSLDVKARDLLVAVIHQSMEENGLIESVQQDGESLLEEERSYAGEGGGRFDHPPGDLEVLLAGQDMLYVEDEYDSQSSVSSASGSEGGSSAEGSRSGGSDDDASLDSRGSGSAYLTA